MEFSTSEFVWSIINFLVFAGLMTWLFHKPVLKMLADRSNAIEGGLARAEAAQREAEELRKQYQSQIGQARTDAQEIVASANRAAQTAKEQIANEAREEAERLVQRARESIRVEKEQAISALRQEVATLAVMAAGKVLEKTLNDEEHNELARRFVQEAGEVQ